METKILTEQPTKFVRDGDTLTQIKEGWVTEDKETFTRLLRKEVFHYIDGKEQEETEVTIETLETLKGTQYMKRKIKGTLFADVQ
jgi:hypothetical protein